MNIKIMLTYTLPRVHTDKESSLRPPVLGGNQILRKWSGVIPLGVSLWFWHTQLAEIGLKRHFWDPKCPTEEVRDILSLWGHRKAQPILARAPMGASPSAWGPQRCWSPRGPHQSCATDAEPQDHLVSTSSPRGLWLWEACPSLGVSWP